MKIWFNKEHTKAVRILADGRELSISVKEALLMLKMGRAVEV